LLLPLLPSANTTSRISTTCLGGITFGCASGESASTFEAWPGIGTWQPTADGGLGQTCSYKCGPQFVEALPPTCMTNGLVSWKYSCSGKNLNYNYYLSTNCTTSTLLTDQSYAYQTGDCFDFEDQRGYAACSVPAVPGTAFLDFSEESNEGNVQTDEMSAGVVAAIVIIVLFVVALVVVGSCWFVTHYDMRHRLNKSARKAALADAEERRQGTELSEFTSNKQPGGEGDRGSIMSVSDNNEGSMHEYKQPNTIYALLTCSCCYDDYI
jgi:hypothetical protein